jgi:hypothetical protein
MDRDWQGTWTGSVRAFAGLPRVCTCRGSSPTVYTFTGSACLPAVLPTATIPFYGSCLPPAVRFPVAWCYLPPAALPFIRFAGLPLITRHRRFRRLYYPACLVGSLRDVTFLVGSGFTVSRFTCRWTVAITACLQSLCPTCRLRWVLRVCTAPPHLPLLHGFGSVLPPTVAGLPARFAPLDVTVWFPVCRHVPYRF